MCYIPVSAIHYPTGTNCRWAKFINSCTARFFNTKTNFDKWAHGHRQNYHHKIQDDVRKQSA